MMKSLIFRKNLPSFKQNFVILQAETLCGLRPKEKIRDKKKKTN